MPRNLGTDYDELRYTVSNTGQEGIGQSEVDTCIATKNGALANDTQVRDASARLLINPDLFNIADTASDGGKTLIEKYGKGELPSSISQEESKPWVLILLLQPTIRFQ